MYNCYYHPKTEGSNSCKGCKLPVCAGCEGDLGFCPDCMGKRNAVHQLRALRGAVEKKQKLASTTARLRLAIRQMGVGRPSVAAYSAPSAPATPARASMMTRPLPPLDEPIAQPYAPAASVAPARKPARRRSTSNWKYDPDKLAYRAPEGLAAINKKRRPARQNAGQMVADARAEFRFTTALFAKAVSLGLALFVGVLCYQLFFKVAPVGKPAAHPLYTPLTQSERKVVDDTIKQGQPVKKKFVDLPDAMLDSQPRPAQQPPAEASTARSSFAEAAAVARSVAPAAAQVAPQPVYRSAPRTVAAAYVAPRANYAARPQRVVYGSAPAPAAAPATRRQPSLESAIHFSGPGAYNTHRGSASKVEVIHW
ncbi:MAG: hypothetical protein JWM80_3254 [Cyanobacteria bacterium RYN_339]|nr:hypothetical protein [Cyanobacteria bacterium RYN_339]